MSTAQDTKSADSPYQLQLFSNLPLYTTQLVCEALREGTHHPR